MKSDTLRPKAQKNVNRSQESRALSRLASALFALGFFVVGSACQVGSPPSTLTSTAVPIAAIPPTPDLEATVEARVQATIAAIPTSTPTTTPTLTPTPTPTPEPGVMLQLISGAVGLAWLNRRRNRSSVGPRRATARRKKVQRR